MPRRDGWEFGRFCKRFSWVPTMVLRSLSSDHGVEMLGSNHRVEDLRLDHADRQLSSAIGTENGVLCDRVEFSTVYGDGQVFRVPTSEDELRSKTPWDVPNVEGDVSIVWYERLFKNCVSFLVSKNRSQKLINGSYLKQKSPLVFASTWVPLLYIYCVVSI